MSAASPQLRRGGTKYLVHRSVELANTAEASRQGDVSQCEVSLVQQASSEMSAS
jgi:hypothetical protein